MANKNDRPRDMANDIIGLVREGTKKWTQYTEGRGTQPRFTVRTAIPE